MGWEINTCPDFFFFFLNKLLQGNQIADEKKVFYITEFWLINAGGMTVTSVNYWNNVHRQQSSMAAETIKCKAGG